MKLALLLGFAVVFSVVSAQAAEPADQPEAPVYELRVYYAAPGKLEELHARFRNHTCQLFEKHGMRNVGYWVPLENPENKLIYLLEHPSVAAREAAFKEFVADPAWQAAHRASEENGKLVTKVESHLMRTTDYSPALKIEAPGERVFELRRYTTTPGNLDALHARFRNHTCQLFAKHGMTNLVYFNLLEGQPGAENTLVYFLAHKSPEAGQSSFTAFRADPVWLAARTASEEKAGSSLTVENGVQSLYLKPVDYSPLK